MVNIKEITVGINFYVDAQVMQSCIPFFYASHPLRYCNCNVRYRIGNHNCILIISLQR